MKKMLLLTTSAAMLAMPLAGPALAGEVCETGVIVHEDPKVSTNPIFVETGEYEPYSDCLRDLAIGPFVCTTTDPEICV